MTRNTQMSLLGEAISVAQSTKLQIDVIAGVVHITHLSSLPAIIQTASAGGAPTGAHGFLQTAHIFMQQGVSPPSLLGSLATPFHAMFGSAIESFSAASVSALHETGS
jgi:hypothetical protein